jgi:hypothetical protein
MRRLPLTRRFAPTSPRKRGEVNKEHFFFIHPALAHSSFTIPH